MGFERGHCPKAEAYFKQTISLPLHAGLTANEQMYVCQQLAALYQHDMRSSFAVA
jgi:dTDP-4-amino-4,6-dideoxygalactose transaminase